MRLRCLLFANPEDTFSPPILLTEPGFVTNPGTMLSQPRITVKRQDITRLHQQLLPGRTSGLVTVMDAFSVPFCGDRRFSHAAGSECSQLGRCGIKRNDKTEVALFMINIYSPYTDDWSSNGLAILTPTECRVSEEAGGNYDLVMTHPVADDMRWKTITEGCIVKAPVPACETPSIELKVNGIPGASPCPAE